jgi:hypothetical protein
MSSHQTWKPTHTRKKEVLRALGIFQRATGEQLRRMLRPGDRHDRITRDTLNALKGSGLVRVETRLESGHQLWVLTERGHKEARLLLPKHLRISALRKPGYDQDGRPTGGDGYDEHAAAVTSTAAVLTAAGFGTPLSWQTEIGHKLPYGYMQYADLTMRAPDAGVPAMLLEVDRVTEPVDDLVAKVRRYTEWSELLAPKADANKEKAARRRGAAVHDFGCGRASTRRPGGRAMCRWRLCSPGRPTRSAGAGCGAWSRPPGPTSPAPSTPVGASPPSTTTRWCPWSSPNWSGSPPTLMVRLVRCGGVWDGRSGRR